MIETEHLTLIDPFPAFFASSLSQADEAAEILQYVSTQNQRAGDEENVSRVLDVVDIRASAPVINQEINKGRKETEPTDCRDYICHKSRRYKT